MVQEKGRASRRSAGLVNLRGIETLGWAGPATEVVTRWCCHRCAEAGEVLPGHEDCQWSPAAAQLVAEGVLVARKLDGEWRLVLTDLGVVTLAAVHEGRVTRARAAARTRRGEATP